MSFHKILFPYKDADAQSAFSHILSLLSVVLYLCYPLSIPYNTNSALSQNISIYLLSALLIGFLLPTWLSSRISHRCQQFFVTVSTLCSLPILPLQKLLSLFFPKQHKAPAHRTHIKPTVHQEFNEKLKEALISFEDLIVREVMIPKIDIFALPEDLSIQESMHQIISEGYSRVPVYKKSIDTITGIVLVKDLIATLQNHPEEKSNRPLSSIAKPVMYTPEIKKATLMLQDFRQQRRHLAIVVNEYGYTEGIVTMEDIIEEIVGEISDEYDNKEDLPYRKTGNSWIVDGRMNISDAEELFQLHIDHENSYDTLGGHVFHKLGAVPQKGMKLNHEEFDIEIISCSERSIGKLKITPLKKQPPSSD